MFSGVLIINLHIIMLLVSLVLLNQFSPACLRFTHSGCTIHRVCQEMSMVCHIILSCIHTMSRQQWNVIFPMTLIVLTKSKLFQAVTLVPSFCEVCVSYFSLGMLMWLPQTDCVHISSYSLSLSELLTVLCCLCTYCELEIWLHSLLTLTLDGGEWSTSHPGCFLPGEQTPGIQGSVGPGANLDLLQKNSGRLACSLVILPAALSLLFLNKSSVSQ
jgi:hypothetical protein